MCGIVGILGQHEAAPILVEALKRLEYRGYDSAGIATVRNGTLGRRRALGKLAELSDLLVHEPLAGKIGIGHTRWATHGVPSVDNAHPHRTGPVAVVHNGIIENFRDLRADLDADGLACETQTDTEVVGALAAREMARGAAPAEAVRATLSRLRGAFALAFLFDGQDDLIIAARRGSPLAIGYGDAEMYLGSDAIALAPLTDRISYLEEGDMAVLTRAGVTIEDANGAPVQRKIRRLAADTATVEKGGHKYYMAKEMAEQPAVIEHTLRAYLPAGADRIMLPDGQTPGFAGMSRLTLVACGTAYYACMTAKYWFEQLARLPVEVDIASEFRYRDPVFPAGSMALFVSQSGETADTLAALRHAAASGIPVASVVNVPESSIARESDLIFPTLAGTEIGVASTKAFTCQLTVLAALALKAAADRGTLPPDSVAGMCQALARIPAEVNQALAAEAAIADIGALLAEARDVLFLGRGTLFPLALEGALKLKEISYIHAEGYASGELKHGPIALIDPHVPVVVLAPRDRLYDKTMSNMQEVMARQGRIVLVSDAQGLAEAGNDIWRGISMPETPSVFAPIVYAVPAQMLAYHTAVAKGTDVDQPRNLAKSVTVE